MRSEELHKAYDRYCKTDPAPASFGVWCAFIHPLPEKEIRIALASSKTRNKDFIDSQKDTIWTPEGRVKMNPEYIDNAVRLRKFQRRRKAADLAFHSEHASGITNEEWWSLSKKEINLKLKPDPIGPIKKVSKWIRKKRKEYDDRRSLRAFREGKYPKDP